MGSDDEARAEHKRFMDGMRARILVLEPFAHRGHLLRPGQVVRCKPQTAGDLVQAGLARVWFPPRRKHNGR